MKLVWKRNKNSLFAHTEFFLLRCVFYIYIYMYINDTRREERKKKTYTLKESHRSTRKPAASSVTRAIISSFANDVRLGSPPVWSCHSRITSTFSLPSPRCCTPSYGPRQASCSEYACFRSTNGSHDVERKHTIGGNCRTHTHEIQIREIATRIRFSPLSLSLSLCLFRPDAHESFVHARPHGNYVYTFAFE